MEAGPREDGARAEKARLRSWARRRRAALSPTFQQYAAAALFASVERLPALASARAVMAYASLPGEIHTRPVLARVLAMGKRLLLPRVSTDRSRLEVYEVRDLDHDLGPQGKLNILEPFPSRCRRADLSTLDLMLMPGLVFDARGGRIGYGAGYFDRLLAGLSPMPERIALAFDFQILPRIPQLPQDVAVNGYATEAGLYRVRCLHWRSASPGETRAAAGELLALLPRDVVVGLCGELGAGKTEWTRGFLGPLMRNPDELASPSYALLNVYAGRQGPLRHVDLYRLADERGGGTGFPELGEILALPGRTVVEWADVLASELPRETVWVDFTVEGEGQRRLEARWLERLD